MNETALPGLAQCANKSAAPTEMAMQGLAHAMHYIMSASSEPLAGGTGGVHRARKEGAVMAAPSFSSATVHFSLNKAHVV